ncbi:unnamed protein product [Clonostachys rosea]|uniref:Exo-1,4-beta-D-glucosaminidase n=1 Tax=Bionectria ochroleuca TaxID=29856 RepID=A0ABY6UPR7_BIOOC|nr:unnamed protein product [Clonostachys rosea]
MPAWRVFLTLALSAIGPGYRAAAVDPIVSQNGQVVPIPSWDIVSSADVSDSLSSLARAGVDTGSWQHVPLSRCTLMGCMIEAGLYDEHDLWFSNNLEHVDRSQFDVPWIYRSEFAVQATPDRHYVLPTHGISSSGEIWLNGVQIANETLQSGSHSGHNYDITKAVVNGTNALVIKVNPTNYYRDLAIAWVDWNPAPPDNGTGVWRDVQVHQTGPLRFSTALSAQVSIDPGAVSLRVQVQNLKACSPVEAVARAVITAPDGDEEFVLEKKLSLEKKASQTLEFNQTFENPQIWWPKQWGEQPLYTAKISISVDNVTSDVAEHTFGLRTVTKEINADDDIVFYVNGQAFQVFGGGFGSDMFLRWDGERFESIVKYMLDVGYNTLRLEGKNEQPELYEIADRYGLMVMAGWECCDKWEAFEYNTDLPVDPVPVWNGSDYDWAGYSMLHEAQMMQSHPSMLAYLVGSDYWPDDKATKIYVDALQQANWQVPIVAAASKRGYPDLLGPTGMKMEGPYDWIPPNYWYDTEPSKDRYGSAFGFGSELGAGVGTPELGSLKNFLTESDMDDLWKNPEKGLYHMSTSTSSFYTRTIYNEGLYKRYGSPTSLDDYLLKAQVSDYESTRAQHEGFAAHWSTGRVATGMIYWMLDNAWPSLHWNIFDRYLHPAGSYFGTKVGTRPEHVAYDYVNKDIWLINRSLDKSGSRTIDVDIIDLKGKEISKSTLDATTAPNKAVRVGEVSGLDKIEDAVFLRLNLRNDDGDVLSRNVYWLAKTIDALVWENSTWYYTPVSDFANYTSLFKLDPATVKASSPASESSSEAFSVTLENESEVPAFFIRLTLVDEEGNDVNPVTWSDNYVTLWPKEKLELTVHGWDGSGTNIQISGGNIEGQELEL